VSKRKLAYGLAGNILKVDLSSRRMEVLKTVEFESGFWGGRGLNQHLLLDLEPEGVSPFDPESILAFGAGRLVGTAAPGAVRMNIDSRNPFTGGIGSSNIGGGFAREFKKAGFDHLLVSGKSEGPVYLWISNKAVEIRDAKPLWGKLISETDRMLMRLLETPDFEFIAIGPAGENRVWASALMDRHSRAAARCGLGAIMGDKGLKAVVAQGISRDNLELAHPERFSRLVKEMTERLASLPSVKRKRILGTLAAVGPLNRSGAIPVRNFEDESLSEDELNYYLAERFDELSAGTIHCCSPCPIHCQHSYRGALSEDFPRNKLEANSILDFGPRLGLTSAEDILHCHALCSQYGLDIDTTASVICWAIDCFEKGILTPSDTDSLALQWGKSEVVFKVIEKIALRQGIGELLAEGSCRASLRIGRGSQDLVFAIKGQDLIEPIRSCKGWALGVAVSPRGGTHTRGAPQTEFQRVDSGMGERIWGVETAGVPKEYEGKAKLVLYYERFHAVLDSLGLCHFVSNWSSPDLLGPIEIAELCSAALGEELSDEILMTRGERILTLEKVYNLLHTDWNRKEDDPPERFFQEPIQRGLFKGEKLHRDKWNDMLTEYYLLHDWDPQTSFPRKRKLEALGLGAYVGVLQKRNRIG
jgi:aldehyde:ferredoxin oxidoreductase